MEVIFYSEIQPECRLIRNEVFIEEQGFSYEYDERDATAEHALVWDGETPIAAARMFDRDGELVIGRFAVRKSARGRSVGALLLGAMLERAKSSGYAIAVVDAQIRARGFYAACGFIAEEGHEHYEDGVAHIRMTKRLR